MPDSRWKLVSIRTLCEEGDPRRKSRSNLWSIFLSTPSARRATERPIRQALELSIFIHALREEGDDRGTAPSGSRRYFYPRPLRGGRQHAACGDHAVGLFLSTPSARRATATFAAAVQDLEKFLSTPSARRATTDEQHVLPESGYFYPRPPRGGRQSCPHSRLQRLGISIHALREEGDLHPGDVDWPPVISIHALREEGDISSSAVFSAMGVFLSTPSARRATPEWRGMLRSGCNFYPRPPRGGRRRGVWLFSTCPHISIHALREEGDVCAIYDISELISFLSTPSARRATCCGPRGGDSGCYFYPRPPRGGRLNTYEQRLAATGFLSTPSARRATATATSLGYSVEISIHALREEGDCTAQMIDPELVQFLSTPSARRATRFGLCAALPVHISIHALREEGDQCGLTSMPQPPDFYPRPPRGGRPRSGCRSHAAGSHFYPRPPRGGRLPPTMFRRAHTNFYPRPPRGGRRCSAHGCPLASEFLSTPSARRATRPQRSPTTRRAISIHALREEGDRHIAGEAAHHADFYPRPPRGGRPSAAAVREMPHEFLSTPSARRATVAASASAGTKRFLSTPSARRATRQKSKKRHSSRFLSTPSARRATDALPTLSTAWMISIHALREEGDL